MGSHYTMGGTSQTAKEVSLGMYARFWCYLSVFWSNDIGSYHTMHRFRRLFYWHTQKSNLKFTLSLAFKKEIIISAIVTLLFKYIYREIDIHTHLYMCVYIHMCMCFWVRLWVYIYISIQVLEWDFNGTLMSSKGMFHFPASLGCPFSPIFCHCISLSIFHSCPVAFSLLSFNWPSLLPPIFSFLMLSPLFLWYRSNHVFTN